jgi:hypothetical protein
MNMTWKHWITVACIVAATSPAIAQNKDSLVITGNHWMKASTSERRVFLIGAGNMIAAELAYAKRHSREAPPVSDGIIKAVKDLKIGDIETRITRWYEANPDKLSTPVMGVLWGDIVKQQR